MEDATIVGILYGVDVPSSKQYYTVVYVCDYTIYILSQIFVYTMHILPCRPSSLVSSVAGRDTEITGHADDMRYVNIDLGNWQTKQLNSQLCFNYAIWKDSWCYYKGFQITQFLIKIFIIPVSFKIFGKSNHWRTF